MYFLRIQADAPRVFENDTIKTVAERNGKSAAQVVLRWLVQRGCTVIPKSSSPARIKENMQVKIWTISERGNAPD